MPAIHCYVDDYTFGWLEKASAETGRPISELAESAIDNAAIEYKVSRLDYGKPPPQENAPGQTLSVDASVNHGATK